MSKFILAIAAACFALGMNTSMARDTPSTSGTSAKTWKDFQTQVRQCDALTGAQRTQCMADAKDAYRASQFNCDTLSATDKAQCKKYSDQWNTAGATQDGSTPVRSGDSNANNPATPSDPTDELKNRDSRKQEGDASRALPEPQKQN